MQTKTTLRELMLMAAKIVTIVTGASQCGKTGDDLEFKIVTTSSPHRHQEGML